LKEALLGRSRGGLTSKVHIAGDRKCRPLALVRLDASVWMQGDLDEQKRLLVARDGDSPEQLEHVANWLMEELPFMLREKPWARATMIVAGPPQIDHDPNTELVVAPPTSP
jgi:hypothetical protein